MYQNKEKTMIILFTYGYDMITPAGVLIIG
jgi:hypothetical protein